MANLDEKYEITNRSIAFENHESGILVSLAGPGTGKTYSLLKRVQALTKRGEDVESICYITFIKEISNAFIADCIEEFGEDSFAAARPRISTLHSFACRLLRNRGFQIGFDGELYFLNITDKDDNSSKILLEDLLPLTTETKYSQAQLKKLLNQAKESWRNCDSQDLLPEPVKLILPPSLDLFHAYRLIDWDQTIPKAHDLLRILADVPDWISQIKHYLIDEYQDFNKAEQGFITSLFSSAKSTVIVGDDNQSLYSSRGGSPDALRDLYTSSQCDQISLILCRRCRSRIVAAANTFLSTMQSKPRLMVPLKDDGDIVSLSFKSTKAEIEYLTKYLSKKIQELPEKAGKKDGIVCLFPTWKLLNFYYDKLSAELPCSKRKETTDPNRLWLQLALQLVAHPGQRFIERLLLENFNEIKPRHKRTLVRLILERDISPTRAVETLVANGILSGPAAEQATCFISLCEGLSSQDSKRIAEEISRVLHIDFQFVQPNIEVFLSYIGKPEQEEKTSSVCDILIPESALPAEDPKVILFLTMHGAKGLTRKTVVMPGLEEAWLPGQDSGEDLEEGKRLFYVALTRATDHVLITVPYTRAQGDPLNYSWPGRGKFSPFVRAVGIPCTYIK